MERGQPIRCDEFPRKFGRTRHRERASVMATNGARTLALRTISAIDSGIRRSACKRAAGRRATTWTPLSAGCWVNSLGFICSLRRNRWARVRGHSRPRWARLARRISVRFVCVIRRAIRRLRGGRRTGFNRGSVRPGCWRPLCQSWPKFPRGDPIFKPRPPVHRAEFQRNFSAPRIGRVSSMGKADVVVPSGNW